MSKRRPLPGRCVHCLKYFDLLTWDHVLPESWYPEGTGGLEKWEIPSCEPCNKELGKIEEDLLIRLGMCLEPKELMSLGIPDKVLRSITPENGKNERDQRVRKGKREKILKEITVFKELPQNIFPNFGPLPGVQYQGYPSLRLSREEVIRFSEKITRGIAYIADSSFIDEGYKIEPYIVDDQSVTELMNLMDQSGMIFDRRPGFLVKRLLAENDKVGGIYFIEIWDRFKIHVIVSPNDLEKRVLGT